MRRCCVGGRQAWGAGNNGTTWSDQPSADPRPLPRLQAGMLCIEATARLRPSQQTWKPTTSRRACGQGSRSGSKQQGSARHPPRPPRSSSHGNSSSQKMTCHCGGGSSKTSSGGEGGSNRHCPSALSRL